MPTTSETRIRRTIKENLRNEYGGWWVVLHGNMFQAIGLPDIIGLVNGKFFGLEVKRPDKLGTFRKVQRYVRDQINLNGGHATVVTNWAEANSFVFEELHK